MSEMQHACGVMEGCWGKAGPEDPEPKSAYIHVPFCHHRCGYCNFTVVAGRNDLIAPFTEALHSELGFLGDPKNIETLYVGGGTPSLLASAELVRLLEGVKRWLRLSPEGEFTIEANPNDLDSAKVDTLIELGCNRISLGVQSFDAAKLKTLERVHSPSQAMQAIERALQCGKACVDLIFGVPGESFETWINDIDSAIASGAQHISTYGLTYEKGARFWSLRENGDLQTVAESQELEMYLAAIDRLTSAGFDHYEVSNFARPEFRSRHNQVYWSNNRWWAFGPGAARFVGQTRSVNHRSATTYINRIARHACVVAESERLDDEQMVREQIVFGLRNLEGIDWPIEFATSLSPLISEGIHETIDDYQAKGFLERSCNRLHLTQKGLLISDGLWPKLLECQKDHTTR